MSDAVPRHPFGVSAYVIRPPFFPRQRPGLSVTVPRIAEYAPVPPVTAKATSSSEKLNEP